MIRFVTGDIFVNRYSAQALAHGCNCQGVMGAGIALQVRRRYPKMYAAYKLLCLSGQFNPGDVYAWEDQEEGLVIFNLATQKKWGADIDSVGASLTQMRVEADRRGIKSIAMPAIGSGLGGLSWALVKREVVARFNDWSGDLFVYEKYESGESREAHGTD